MTGWKYGVLQHLSIADLSIECEDESWALFSSLISPLLASRLKRWIMEGLRRFLIFVYLHWRSLHTKGTEWNASLPSQPTYLFWFLWVFFLILGSFFAPVDKMVIKSMNSASQGFYCLLIMIMAFRTNAHMLLISPTWQWIYFMQNVACFPRDRRGNWFVHDKCLCLSEKTEWTSQKIGGPVFVPCADDYRYALHPRHESLMVPQAAICPWKTGTAPKPQLLRQVGKTQSVLSSEDFKQPIAVTKKKRNSHGALVRLFCRLRTCSVHRVGYWEMSEEKSQRQFY